jgi:hypothetical protein
MKTSIYYVFDTSDKGSWCHFRTQDLSKTHRKIEAANLQAQATNKLENQQKNDPSRVAKSTKSRR